MLRILHRIGARWALVAALALTGAALAVACGDDGDEPAPEPTATATSADVPVEPSGDVLHIGVVLPETGALSIFNPPMLEAAKLAEADILEQGGAIRVTYADSGTNPDVAVTSVNRLLGEGAHVIVGAAASGISQSFIQILFDEQIPQCSPSNTSPSFSTQENAAYYFRTVPPDEAVSPIIADEVVRDGGARVAIVARADDYGNALADLLRNALLASGAETLVIPFDPQATTFAAEVAEVAFFDPDAVVHISFAEGANIIRGLIEAGIGPEKQYGADGLFVPTLWEQVNPDDPNVLDGMKLIAAGGGADFNDRLGAITDGNVIYGGQAYDCMVLMALAARQAGATDGDSIIEALATLTDGGTSCSGYGECAALIDAGTNIDYVGVSGPLNLDAVGDPTVGTYLIAQFRDGVLVPVSSQEVDIATLGEMAPPPEVALRIGVVLPETGALSAYGVPMIASVRLAIDDITAAGGDVEVIYADSGTDPDVAQTSVNRLLGEGAHAVVGAASSGISQAIIQTLYDEGVPQCSPSNTSPSFSTQANAGYYFRTAPADTAMAVIMADTVASRGGTRVSIVARADDYGRALSSLLSDQLAGLGAESEIVNYDPQAATFDAEVSAVTNYAPDAVVLIVFEEGLGIIRGLLEAGLDPSTFYGSDGIYRADLGEAVNENDPTVLDGMTVFVASAPAGDVIDEFNDRLAAEVEGNFAFGAQSYDCTIILALAAKAAGSTGGDAIIAAVSEVTSGGTECYGYADCAGLLDTNADIAYVGKVGPLALNAIGDPTIATYTIARFEAAELVEQEPQVVDLSR